MKKLCLVNYDMSIVGGAESVTATLANELSDVYEIAIYSLHNSNNQLAFWLEDRIQFEVADQIGGNLRFRQVILKDIKNLRNFIKKNKIDVIVAMGAYVGMIGTSATIGLKTKSIYLDHGALVNELNDKLTTLFRYWNAIFSSKVVVLTDRTKYDYHKYFKIRKQKVVRIYNAIEESLQDNFDQYDTHSQKIVSVGRITEEKGFDMLLEIADLVLKKHENWTWEVYGDGPLLEDIKDKARCMRLDNQLKFLGQNKMIKFSLYKYAFLVLPSYREGLPLVLLEGKANGLPLISFDVETGPREIIRDKENGFLVPKYDREIMAKKIEMLIQSKELRIEFHHESQQDIEQFSLKEIKKQWITLINEN